MLLIAGRFYAPFLWHEWADNQVILNMVTQSETPNETPPVAPENVAHEKRDRSGLSFIRPQETRRAVKARGPQRVVNFLRTALPVLALCVLIALILWPVIAPNTIKGVIMKNIPDLVVKNLHFNGLDSKNEPYSLTADKATRPSGVANVYDLEHPQAEITLATGAWVAGKSLYGRYDQDTRKLWLGGDVQLFHDKGYQFTSDEAQIDLKNNDAWGEKPVLIQGDFGEIRGQGFKLLDSGHIMVVTGPAHAVLSLKAKNLQDKPGSDKPGPDKPPGAATPDHIQDGQATGDQPKQ